MAVGSHHYGAPAFGQTQWTPRTGPVGVPVGSGLPGTRFQPSTRIHSLGPIPAMPVIAPATDADAWQLVRQIDAKRKAGDVALRKLGVHPPANLPFIERIIAGKVEGGTNRIKALEQAGFPDRYLGDVSSFRTLADELALYLYAGRLVQLKSGAIRTGMPPIAGLSAYLEGARVGQIPHAAVESPAFITALKHAYAIAHLTEHVRSARGQAVRWVRPAPSAVNDWAWRYSDESGPGLPSGYVGGHHQVLEPGPQLDADAYEHGQQLDAALTALSDELRANMIEPPGAPLFPAARGLLTAALVIVAGGLIYTRYGRKRVRWPKLGGRKKARGANGRARTLQLT